jgi:glycosyltransferase involved in cell wall biosynthesis
VVAVSGDVRDRRNISAIRKKTCVIRNGVDIVMPSRDREAIRREIGLQNEFTIIIVARVDGLKGHHTLFKAIASLRDRDASSRMPITLLVVGDGAARGELEVFARGLGLTSKQVRFLGFRSDALDLLAASDLFVLPSHSEGLPLSALEAMSQRLAVIATPVGGVPEVVEDGLNGLLIPVDDDAALANAIARLMRDPALRATMGERGYDRIQSEFRFSEMVNRYEELYRLLLDSRK